ncbi:MAG: hypothetical protein AB7V42_13355 [Thermoleophilia bacterium]
MTGDRNRALIAELRAGLEARRTAGETDPDWLAEEVEILDLEASSPVDRFLQTPPDPSPAAQIRARVLRRTLPGFVPGRAETRLREAITWLKTSFDHERLLARERARRLDDLEGAGRQRAARMLRGLHPQLIASDAERALASTEARVFSPGGEDGIVAHLLAELGTEGRRFAELGLRAGEGSIAANLAVAFGWRGAIACDDPAAVEELRRLVDDHPTAAGRIAVTGRIDAAGLARLLADHGPAAAIDVLVLRGSAAGLLEPARAAGADPALVVVRGGPPLLPGAEPDGYALAGRDVSRRSAFLVRRAAGVGDPGGTA